MNIQIVTVSLLSLPFMAIIRIRILGYVTAPNESRMADEELPCGMVPSPKRPRLGSLSSNTSGEYSNVLSRYRTRQRRVIIMNDEYIYPPGFGKLNYRLLLLFH